MIYELAVATGVLINQCKSWTGNHIGNTKSLAHCLDKCSFASSHRAIKTNDTLSPNGIQQLFGNTINLVYTFKLKGYHITCSAGLGLQAEQSSLPKIYLRAEKYRGSTKRSGYSYWGKPKNRFQVRI